jgi:hypothetical protein
VARVNARFHDAAGAGIEVHPRQGPWGWGVGGACPRCTIARSPGGWGAHSVPTTDALVQLLRQGNVLIVLVHAPALAPSFVADAAEDPADAYQGMPHAAHSGCAAMLTSPLHTPVGGAAAIGHYIVLLGCAGEAHAAVFAYHDPSGGAESGVRTVPADALERARAWPGTDDDVLVLRCPQPAPV